jgi:hypothetical protein
MTVASVRATSFPLPEGCYAVPQAGCFLSDSFKVNPVPPSLGIFGWEWLVGYKAEAPAWSGS